MRKILIGILFICLSAVSLADEVQLRSDHPDTHIVQKGDTLWDISSLFLKDPWLWPDLWHINPQIENPHLIYPGDKLRLVKINGQPKVIVAERGPVKLLAEMRTQPLHAAIPAIPLEKINAFLSKSRIIENAKILEDAPYILASEDKRILAGAGDQVYARGDFEEGVSAYGVYRAGDIYQDPVTKEILGMQARDIASIRQLDMNEDVGTFVVNRSAEEVRVGDRLLASEIGSLSSSFTPKSPNTKISGQIIAVEGALRNAGKMSVVILNQGEREGLQAGDVLEIRKVGEVVRDNVKKQTVQLPGRKAGLLMVFRVFDKLSLGIVLETSLALAVGDKVQNP